MGDAENALPPSKKRAAGRELTRDTPIDDEEDAPELETGTFKRASQEVMGTRRIVKVRRQPTNSAPSANPFAGIRLVAPTESSANPAETTTEVKSAGENTVADESKSNDTAKDSEKAGDGEAKQPESKTNEAEDKLTESKDAAEESNADKEHTAEKESTDDESKVDKEQNKDVTESGNEDKKDATHNESASKLDKEKTGDGKDSENDDKNENTNNVDKKDSKAESAEPSAEGGHLKSFQLLSSSQNAFTGLAGTGFSNSSFSFGSISNEGSGSIFGLKSDKPFGLGLSNNGSSLLGASGASAVSKNEGSGLAMQEVVVETGEENEEVVFNADSVLFEFADGSWKERGKGELKVNVSSETKKARLLMRSKGNFRLILNARLYPDMKLTNMDKKGVTFACINSASEGKGGLSTFALKFKDGSIVEEFKATVMEHKGETSTVLKTPENSPKASDD
ncbi:nuclear pore complex protein NUP50A-like [Glycine soja]|uniref:E3 SUMO-protein ligase RanBP2 n=1 Tax=Glycine soja TaxID=3848 RepID=A0A0B2NU93_GLYSO|nr:nuclear pore complex protein NUP50A-like [Glycine soja]KHM98772.1 E3 SUMO-protein ligase RanBP2 [Glycine soja]RZB62450.1 Nuclear pore complex protein NUP50A isoform A [Glycine soja]RZB62451.1 Nuclear pore complex protein NUP50A isoform B [Glycine soja]RZB62452.1 Nuclear pore complex protein NUP50A isoform C [Glycine soja]